MERVDFFIAGVQKAGTSALDHYLRFHPAIAMAAAKEVHFFDDDSIDWSKPGYARLHQAFDSAPSGIIRRGEATPIYTYWPDALARIQRYNPAARLIVLLRHPSLRAWSHWRMEIKRNAETLSFAEAVDTGRARVADAPGGVHRVFSYVERGFYAAQIRNALRLFAREQVYFCRTDRLWHDPTGTLAEICGFLGVPPQPTTGHAYVAPVLAWSPEPMPAKPRAMLDAMYAPDIRETATLTGLNLDDWLNAGYREPMMPD